MGLSTVALGLAPVVGGAVLFFDAAEPDAAGFEAAALLSCCSSCGAACATAVATSSMIPRTILNCNLIAILPLIGTVLSHTSALPVTAILPPPRCLLLDYFSWHRASDP